LQAHEQEAAEKQFLEQRSGDDQRDPEHPFGLALAYNADIESGTIGRPSESVSTSEATRTIASAPNQRSALAGATAWSARYSRIRESFLQLDDAEDQRAANGSGHERRRGEKRSVLGEPR
jgi:hypothetical protein